MIINNLRTKIWSSKLAKRGFNFNSAEPAQGVSLTDAGAAYQILGKSYIN